MKFRAGKHNEARYDKNWGREDHRTQRSYFPLGGEEGQICVNLALVRLTLPVFIHLALSQVPWFPDLLDLEA